MNEERTGLLLRQMAHIRGYSTTVNQVMYNFRSEDCHLTATKTYFISYLVSSSSKQENHDWNYEL